MKRVLIWFCMISKSLFKKYSYLLILLAVPVLVCAMTFAAQKESGVMTILLYQENSRDDVSSRIVEELLNQKSVIRFTETNNEAEAIESVLQKKADAVWIFDGKMTERIEEYVGGKKSKSGIVKVYELKDNVLLQLSREKLFSAIYPYLSYSLYHYFVTANLVETALIEQDDVFFQNAYHQYRREDEIITFAFSEAADEIDLEKVNYLTSPLRGMLAMVIVLSSFAAQMYFLKDWKQGLFVWMPKSAKYLIPYGYELAAMLPICITVYIALLLSGLFTGAAKEFFALLLFLLMMIPFSNILRRIFREVKVFGALIPVFILIMVVFSPIFLEVSVLKPIQMFLPIYYYLSVVYHRSILGMMLLYMLIAYLADGITYVIFERNH